MKAPILSDAEIAQLKAHYADRPRDRFLLELIFDLGLRPMEIAGLQADWFRVNELRIPLGHSKRKAGRSLPIQPHHVDMLRTVVGNRAGHVFLNRYGEPMTPAAVSELVRKLFIKAGLTGSTYSGRRGRAQKLLDANVNLLVIQKFLGHSNPMTTLSYVECSANQLRDALFGA